MLQHGDDRRERGRVPDFPERIEGVPHHEPPLVIEPRQQRGDRRHSHAGQHFAHPYPDPAVWLLREERRERLRSLWAGETQIFARDVHRPVGGARRRGSTRGQAWLCPAGLAGVSPGGGGGSARTLRRTAWARWGWPARRPS